MTLFVTEPPLGAPVALAVAKAHLRIETADEDELVGELIAAATSHLESETGLALMTQKWRLCLDAWPRHGPILLARSPVRTVDAVTVYDTGGNPAALDLSGAILDANARPARLHLAGVPRPGRALNGIEIDFTAGFGDTGGEVPDALRQAILQHVAHMYEFRGAVAVPQQPAGLPAGYGRLVAPYRRRAL